MLRWFAHVQVLISQLMLEGLDGLSESSEISIGLSESSEAVGDSSVSSDQSANKSNGRSSGSAVGPQNISDQQLGNIPPRD